MYDLSIIVPSIRSETLFELIKQIKNSIYLNEIKYTYQIKFIGPNFPNKIDMNNVQYIESFRNPAACVQEGVSYSNSKFICWLPDDIRLESMALGKCIQNLKTYTKKDGIILRYSEGINFTGHQDQWLEYWRGITHDSLKLKHISPNWKIAPVFMYNTDYFKEMGGLDCRFEHVNLNTHDLAFRMQLNGSQLYFSPTKVFSTDWDEKLYEGQHKSVQLAYDENDLPLFKSIWDKEILERSIKIDFDNWKNTDEKWSRRFK